jgi:hypothetical protein
VSVLIAWNYPSACVGRDKASQVKGRRTTDMVPKGRRTNIWHENAFRRPFEAPDNPGDDLGDAPGDDPRRPNRLWRPNRLRRPKR